MKMQKTFVLFCFVFLFNTLYAQDLNNLYTDLRNAFRLGYRPISQGLDVYLYNQGVLITTFSETDFSISGEGFFILLDEGNDKLLLTRNGAFHFNDDGFFVNHENFRVLSSRSNIKTNEYIFITRNDKIDMNNFLIGMPIVNEIIINPEYIESKDFLIYENNIIIHNTLESMPILLKKIIDDILYYFNRTDIPLGLKNIGFKELKEECSILFRNNFLVFDILINIFEMLNEIEYILMRETHIEHEVEVSRNIKPKVSNSTSENSFSKQTKERKRQNNCFYRQ